MSVPTVPLNNGVEMPLLGFGVFQIADPQVQVVVRWLTQRGVVAIPKSSAESAWPRTSTSSTSS